MLQYLLLKAERLLTELPGQFSNVYLPHDTVLDVLRFVSGDVTEGISLKINFLSQISFLHAERSAHNTQLECPDSVLHCIFGIHHSLLCNGMPCYFSSCTFFKLQVGCTNYNYILCVKWTPTSYTPHHESSERITSAKYFGVQLLMYL